MLNESGCEIRSCFRCGRTIKGRTVYHVPPTLNIQLGLDFVKTFHPACYRDEQAQSVRELTYDRKAVQA